MTGISLVWRLESIIFGESMMPSSFTRRFLITYFIFCFLVCVEKGLAAEPTLARLSFWVPEERMAEFEVAYLKKVVPVLKGHGLVESSEPGRTTVQGGSAGCSS